jgi:hypothetical protein
MILVGVFGKQNWQARIFLRRFHFNARDRADSDRALSSRFRLASAIGTAAQDAITGHIGRISLGLNNRVPIEGKISGAWWNR